MLSFLRFYNSNKINRKISIKIRMDNKELINETTKNDIFDYSIHYYIYFFFPLQYKIFT
jgi:hypothetical protein